MNQRVWAACLALLLSFTPATASAADILLVPLAGRNVKSTTLTNITSLIYSELDFNSNVAGVNELGSRPSSLGSSCIKSSSCLASIAKMGDNEKRLLTGYVTISGGAYSLQMVLFDSQARQITRNKSFTLGASPEALADGMTGVIGEMLTGKSKNQEVEEETFDFDFEDDEDDFEFEEPSVAEAEEDARRRAAAAEKARELERKRAAEEARRKAEAERKRREAEEAARRAEEERKRREAELARQRALEEQKRKEAEAERRRAEAEARRRAEANRKTETDDFDPNAITFGSAAIIVDDEGNSEPRPTITIEEDEDEDLFLADLDEPDEEFELLDLDDEEPAAPPPRETRSKPEKVKPEPKKPARSSTTSSRIDTSRNTSSDAPVRFELAARGGYSPYFNLGFITYGAEGAIAVGETGVFVLVGVEAYSVQRDIPEEFQDGTGQTTEWNTIFPINAGVTYRLLKGNIQPYVGADAIFAQYYVNQNGGSWTIGARGRTGVNLMVSRNFGFNANVAVGFWSGKNWALIQKDVKASGFLPQISAGTVFAF